MPNSEYIPSLTHLALKYGTITKDQFKQVLPLISGRTNSRLSEAEILLKQGIATRYQIGLLTLIRDYQMIRKKGEVFGKIAVEKGFATAGDIKKALDIQKKEFRKSRLKKLIGDILVASKVITPSQKSHILREQTLLEKKTGQILFEDPSESETRDEDELELSRYEREFLKIKALDEDFTAALLEKGIADQDDIRRAKAMQEEAFEFTKTIKIIGDIMVDLNMISENQRDIIFKEQGRTIQDPEPPLLTVKISKDQMAAWVILDPKTMSNVTVTDVKQALKKAGVVAGIYPEPILQCGIDHRLPMIPVARNDYSQDLRDACQLVSYLDQELSENGEKKKGDVLAEQRPEWTLGSRKTILGTLSETRSDRDFTIRCGSGTRRSRDKTKFLAAKSGRPALSVERLLFIHPVIHVLEDADQRYGPVESYSNLTVSGTITGAYPITAGHVTAREIRGGQIEAIGDIRAKVGITDAVIRAQGDVHARYIHNCRIEIFGNLYVENEIFDSDIRCAGRIDSPGCRVVSSKLFAKQGVVLAGTGSEKTLPCTITAGTEHHLFSQVERLLEEISTVRNALDRLKEKKDEKKRSSRKNFEKMVELKIFHDRAKNTKKMLAEDFRKKKTSYTKDKLKNILNLIANFEKRMEGAILSLKELNTSKKKYDNINRILAEKIERLSPRIDRQVRDLEQTLFAHMEWSRSQPGNPRTEIKGTAYQGTIFRGVASESILDSNRSDLVVKERTRATGESEILFM